MPRIAVIGGGIAGLTAAVTLLDRGAEVVVFEASDRLGGKIQTEHTDGLLIDAGPDSFLSSKPAALELVDRLGLSEAVINTLADGGGTFILRRGQLMPLPEGITLLVPAEFRAIARTPLLSPLGKARMALDVVVPRRRSDEDESIGDFVRRRVGREAFERMAEPLLSGIYAGDADRLSVFSTFPRLHEIERQHGSVIRGAIAQKRQARSAASRPGRRHTPFVSLRGGLGQLIDALADRIGQERIRTEAPVVSLSQQGGCYVVQGDDFSARRRQTDSDAAAVAQQHEPNCQIEERVDGVILAIPAGAAAQLVKGIDPQLTTLLDQIPYVSSATVSLAFDNADVAAKQVGRGFVIPRAEGRTLTAVTWTSNKFGGRAPEGTALLRGFAGRAGNETPAFLPDEELISIVREELRAILGIDSEPTKVRIYRWPNALPQYNLGHQQRLEAIGERLSTIPGMALTGAAYRGVGIPDCIRDATLQAEGLVQRLDVQHAIPV